MPKKRALIKGLGKAGGDVVATDVVMWGIIDGDERIPEFLAAKRQHAQLVMDSLPEALREKAGMVRTYVTIQVVQGRRKPRRAS